MKLLRYGQLGEEKPGIVDAQGIIRDLSTVIPDLQGAVLRPENLNKIRQLNLENLDPVSSGQRIAPCVAGVWEDYVCRA